MKPILLLLILLTGIVGFSSSESWSLNRELENQIKKAEDDPLLTVLGRNDNDEISESSGLSASSFVANAVWTINDSSHPSELYLLKTDGELIGRVKLKDAKNVDWEAMAQGKVSGVPHLIVADVGDNLKRRSSYQIYLLPEPNLFVKGKPESKEPELPVQKTVRPTKLDFTYPGGARDCEAVAVDESANQIWLVEKVYFNAPKSVTPGFYVLPLTATKPGNPRVARRIADFPIRNVTGMAFSADGKYLIVRNYLNAHLYSRTGDQSWEQVVSKTTPKTVVLPLQRQGEAICFTPDSKSVILTSEKKRQTIWQVSLKPYIDRPDGNRKSDDLKSGSK